MRLLDFVTPEDGVHHLRADGAEGVVRELGLALARPSDLDPERLIQLLLRREHVGTTAVGHDIAIPQAEPELRGGFFAPPAPPR